MMKKFILLFFLTSSYFVHAQNEFFTTDGKNRMSFNEVEEIRLGLKEKMTRVMDKPIQVTLIVEESKTVGDSIIHTIKIDATEETEKEAINNKAQNDLIGKTLPNFELQDLEGNVVTLSELKGKPSLLNFWFTGCAPCIKEMPVLNKIASQFKDKVNFIAITFESSSRINRFLERKAFDFLHLVDAQAYIKELDFNEFPKNIFLDENGKVIAVNNGVPYENTEGGNTEISDGNDFIDTLNNLLQKQ